MSVEIKSVDVANEAEEVRINFYQHFGWKLKSSQRVSDRAGGVDFTKLVLERDTNINNYQEICELEQQCYAILEEIDEMPDFVGQFHSSISIEEWAKMGEPQVGGATHVLWGFIGAVIGGLIGLINAGGFSEGMEGPILGLGLIGFLVLFFIVRKFLKTNSWKVGLRFPSSMIGKRMKKLYDDMIEVELEYEAMEEKIAALSEEAAAMLEE